MLVLVDLIVLEVIVAPELGVASSHGVGGFQQVVTEIAVAGLNHPGVLRLEFTGLVFVPDEAGKLGHRGLGIKAGDIANLGDDAGGVDLANAWDRGKCIRDDLELLLNGLVQYLDLLFHGPHRSDGYSHSLVHRIVYSG